MSPISKCKLDFIILNTFLIYFIQSSILYLSSYKRPRKIKRLIKINDNMKVIFFIIIIKGNGRITTISTSKIKKTIPIKKNFKEKGTRDRENGSNPHSKGVFFSLAFFPWKPKEKNKNESKSKMIITLM